MGERDIEELLDEVAIRSIDVCAFCGDCECNGGYCMEAVVEDGSTQDSDMRVEFERLHEWLRWGQAWEALELLLGGGIDPRTAIEAIEERLADAENRRPRPLDEEAGRG